MLFFFFISKWFLQFFDLILGLFTSILWIGSQKWHDTRVLLMKRLHITMNMTMVRKSQIASLQNSNASINVSICIGNPSKHHTKTTVETSSQIIEKKPRFFSNTE